MTHRRDAAARHALVFGTDGYDGAKDTQRRRSVDVRLAAEDHHQTRRGRKKLVANARDLRRNFPDAAWAIRMNAEMIAAYDFRAKTDDEGLNRELEQYIAHKSEPAQFDAAGRLSRQQAARLVETCRSVDGDVWPLKRNTGALQFIEGDRVAIPAGSSLPRIDDLGEYRHGVRIDRDGRPVRVAVCDREGATLKLRRVLDARFFWQVGYFDRVDQTRGVSPIAAALNAFRDASESRELALAKAKVAQYLALVLKRSATEPLGDATQTEGDRSATSIDLGAGPQFVDLDIDEDIDFKTADVPGDSFLEFQRHVIASAILSLDIPRSFWDETQGVFHGNRAAVLRYVRTTRCKREPMHRWHREWSLWQLGVGVRDRELSLGRRDFRDIARAMRWHWLGLQWWDLAKDTDGYLKLIAACLMDPEEVALEVGNADIYDIIASRARVEKAASEAGVALSYQASNTQATLGTADKADVDAEGNAETDDE
ncbi:MAG: phage portal protein [Planctomycetota bacterium]